MKITALAPWFGSKRSLAPDIIEELGPHKAYCEPFCGGMSVLLVKPEARVEIVNDLHGDLINLATVIRGRESGPEFYRHARRMIVSDELLAQADERIRHSEPTETIDIDRALDFFATAWMGRNGEVGLVKSERGRNLAVRWNSNGGNPCTRFANAVLSIPAWRRRLRNVTVLRRDAFKVLEALDDQPGTAIYSDPPYMVKSDEYLYDFDNDDHQRLAHSLRRFKNARVVVSYYEHADLPALYPGWTFIEKHRTKNMGSLAKKGKSDEKRIALECLIVNGPSFAKEAR